MIFQNCLTARKITYNNFEISLMVFMPNITTNHAITFTNINPTQTRNLLVNFTGAINA